MGAPERPPLALRLLLLAGLVAFAGLDHNPLVRFEAWAGLSPAPLERFFGLRGPFSGMTEASYRLVHLDLAGSLRANVLTVPLLAAAAWCLVLWTAPRLRTRGQEYLFLGGAVVAAAINNLSAAWLQSA
ncbi:MAG: DUF2752 domain-containing protein [Sphingomonadaceae bacterium]|nr:DUF2752 domain-containing protein [Sphingomonadaceae bacterium]